MKDSLDVAQLPLRNTLAEIILVHVVGNICVDQIQEFIAFSQIIDHQNVGMTALIQAAHNVAANKASASGYDNHDSSPAVTTEVPNFPTTNPPARLAHRNASNQLRPAALVTARAAKTLSPPPATPNTSFIHYPVCSRPHK